MKSPRKQTAENYIKEIIRKSRRIFTSEQKIQIVMEALRADMSISELCRKYSVNESRFAKCRKVFLEVDYNRLSGDTKREATSDEVVALKRENQLLSYSDAVDVNLKLELLEKFYNFNKPHVSFKGKTAYKILNTN